MRENKKLEIEKSIEELRKDLLNEGIVLTKMEIESIYKNLNNEISNNRLANILKENSNKEKDLK